MNKNNWLHRLWRSLNFKWRKLGSYLACSLCSWFGSLQVLELPPNGVCALPWRLRKILFGRHSHPKLPVVLVWGSDQKAICLVKCFGHVLLGKESCSRPGHAGGNPSLSFKKNWSKWLRRKRRLCLDCYPRKWQNVDRKTNSKKGLFICHHGFESCLLWIIEFIQK